MSSPPSNRRNAADSFGLLARERYISLTTFKRDGGAISTPVWIASDDGTRLLIWWSGAGTWKVKRSRRNPHVLGSWQLIQEMDVHRRTAQPDEARWMSRRAVSSTQRRPSHRDAPT